MFRLIVVVVAAAVLVTACADSSDDAAPTTTTVASLPGADIVLESVTFGGDVATFKPVGWTFDAVTGVASPVGSTEIDSSWAITDDCVRECVARSNGEWAAAVSEVSAVSPALDVIREIAEGDSYLVELHSDEGWGELAYWRWVDGAAQVIVCVATGPDAIIDQLFAALEFACENTRAALDGD